MKSILTITVIYWLVEASSNLLLCSRNFPSVVINESRFILFQIATQITDFDNETQRLKNKGYLFRQITSILSVSSDLCISIFQVIVVFSVLFLAYGLIFYLLLGDEVGQKNSLFPSFVKSLLHLNMSFAEAPNFDELKSFVNFPKFCFFVWSELLKSCHL